MLQWHFSSDRRVSPGHPSSWTWARCCGCFSWVHMLFRWPSSWGAPASSEGYISIKCVRLVVLLHFKMYLLQLTKYVSSFLFLLFIVSCFGCMGWQRSMGTNRTWKSLWRFWHCWRFCCATWCWPLPSGFFLSYYLTYKFPRSPHVTTQVDIIKLVTTKIF